MGNIASVVVTNLLDEKPKDSDESYLNSLLLSLFCEENNENQTTRELDPVFPPHGDEYDEYSEKDHNESNKSSEMLLKALELCVAYHYSTIRRFNAEPYCNHPIAVARYVKDYGIEYEIVALLHDILEDTELKVEDLRSHGFSEEIIDAVVAITHYENGKESHDEYIARCNKNKIARVVKVADMLHNLKDFHIHGKEDKIKRLYKQILYMVTYK